jgi:copper chaperone CopZ
MPMLRFKVPAMHCGGCAKRVRAVIHAADPSATAEADVDKHEVVIAGALSAAAFAQALAAAGYPPDALAA